MTLQEFKTELRNNELLNKHLDIDYLINNSEADTVDELRDEAIELIHEQEVIYYSKAIKYLSENDPSLQISLELAKDLGYSLENINSELLATLLLQNELETELFNIGY